jgi:nucleoside-diphosphate-sugar epimerase
MAEVLVTGANGFVGSHICEALLANGYSVRALVRRTSDLTNIKGLPLHFIQGDILFSETLSEAVSGVAAVINNAGLVKAGDPNDFQRVNRGGTGNIIEAVRRHNPGLTRLVHISSTAACGPAPDNCPITEDHAPNPLTAYGHSKLAAEQAVLANKGNIPSVILRPSAVYGPRDKEMYSFFRTIKLGIKPLFGKGENYINFTYVKDLARAVVGAISTPSVSGSIYFVAEKKAYAYREAGEIISSIMKKRTITLRVPVFAMRMAGKISEGVSLVRGKPSIFTAEKTREILARYWLFDTSKIEREMGFVATDFPSGAEETIAWYKEHGWL